MLEQPVAFADDCVGEAAAKAVAAMKDGDVLLLENTRFHKGEEKNDPAFVAELAKLGDIYVNDAFSAAHRAHASTEGLGAQAAGLCRPHHAGRARGAGRRRSETPKRPVIAIVGGAKVSTKLDLLENLVTKVDALVIGGGMANTFLHAQGVDVGKSLAEKDLADTARAHHATRPRPPTAPSSCRSTPSSPISSRPTRRSHAYGLDAIPADGMILDVGPQSIERINARDRRCRDAGLERPARRLRDARRSTSGTVAAAKPCRRSAPRPAS